MVKAFSGPSSPFLSVTAFFPPNSVRLVLALALMLKMASTTNVDNFYDDQYVQINDLFAEPTDWDALNHGLDQALADPFLPRLHRAEYEALRAWDSEERQMHIERANDAIEDLRLVYEAEGRDQPEVDEILDPLREMVKAVVDDSVSLTDEEYVAPCHRNM